jgi:putative inorganic carbon (hco3(-)) transporter
MKRNIRCFSCEKIFDFLVYLVLALTPVLVIPSLNLDFELAKVVFFRSCVMLMLLVYGLDLIRRGKMKIPEALGGNKVRKCLFFILIVLLISGVFSISRSLSLWGSYYRIQGIYTVSHYFLFFILLMTNFKGKEKWKKAKIAMFGGYTICLLYGIAQVFGLDFFGYDLQEISLGRVFSFLGHPNYFASYILLLLFPLMSYWIVKREKVVLSLILLGLVCLFFTGSRAAFIGLIVGLIIFIVFISSNRGLKVQRKKILGLFLIAIGGVLIMSTLAGDTFQRFNLDEENLRSIKSRVEVWKASVIMLEDRSLIGFGPETFPITFATHSPEELNHLEQFGNMTDKSHNLLIETLSSFGLLGLLLLLYGLYLISSISLRALKKGKLKKDEALNVVAVVSSFAAIFTAHLFGFFVTAHLVIMCFLLGDLMVSVSENEIELKLWGKANKMAKVFLAVTLSFFTLTSILVVNIFPALADYHAARGFKAINENLATEAVNELKLANLLNPKQDYYAYVLASVFSQLDQKEDSLKYLERGGEYSNYQDYYYYYLKGKILSKDCDEDCGLAIESYERAYELAPNYAPTLLNWGKYYLEHHNCNKAVEKFEDYLAITPSSWQTPDTEEYRLFYKHNPDFDLVFEYIASCE